MNQWVKLTVSVFVGSMLGLGLIFLVEGISGDQNESAEILSQKTLPVYSPVTSEF